MARAAARTPATPPMLRALNERTVLDAIRADAPISRAEISRRVGISKPTVSMALRSLLDSGLVREADASEHPGRYGATLFESVPEAALVLGLDMGARFLRGAICDLAGTARARQDFETGGAGARALLDEAVRLRAQLIESSELASERIDGVVVGVPGAVDPQTGAVRLAENIAGLEGLDVRAELESRLGVAVSVENDINLAAVGERAQGVAQGVDDFAFVSIGTGLGAGIVLRGELLRGQHGGAGELDLALGRGDRPGDDPCAAAISAYAAGLAASAPADAAASALSAPFGVPSIFATARAGDAMAQLIVHEAARRIALHIAPVAAVTDVELVVLGGGVGANGDLLLNPVRARLEELLPFPPRLEVSSLGEGAVLAGALAVGLRAALDNAFEQRLGA